MDKDFSSFPITTFDIPLKGLSFSMCATLEELQASVEKAQGKLFVIGGGSNILPIGYIDAHIVNPNIQGITYEEEGDEIYVTSGAGVDWHALVLDTLAKGYSGLENLSLIPGSVGAASIQNIGAYGVELADRVIDVECLDLHSQEVFTLGPDECDFGYRDSIFKHEMKGRVIITGLTLRVDKKPELNLSYGALAETIAAKTNEPTAQDVSDAVIHIRQSKLPDPKEIGNAGSFFKNPIVSKEQHFKLKKEFPNIVAYPVEDEMKLAAAWLIDQCGLKGYQHRETGAGVHDKQALVIVNRGQARGEDLLAVATHVQRCVYAKYAVLLEPEVQIVGDKEKIERSGLIQSK